MKFSILFCFCTLLSVTNTDAQVYGSNPCNGSLGEPVLNETFGYGQNIYSIGNPLPTGITSLIYTSNSCVYYENNYSILVKQPCQLQNWHAFTDHTGDPNGYFMMINASSEPSDFYVRTVNGLCEGNVYQFSAWLLNACMFIGVDPNVRFTVETPDGKVLNSYSTGNIPKNSSVATWLQYGFYFTTPPGVSTVVLRMTNLTIGSSGNDLGLDDIMFRPAGPTTTISTDGVEGSSANTCQSIKLKSRVEDCYVTNAYQWQQSVDNNTWNNIDNATNPDYTVKPSTGINYFRLLVSNGKTSCSVYSNVFKVQCTCPTSQQESKKIEICPNDSYTLPSGKKIFSTGMYKDTVRNVLGCYSLITIVDLEIKKTISIDTSIFICKDSLATLTTSHSYSSYVWNTGAMTPSIQVGAGNYSLTALTNLGCKVINTFNVKNFAFNGVPLTWACQDDAKILDAGSIFKEYLWNTGEVSSKITIRDFNKYWVKVRDDNNCYIQSDTFFITSISKPPKKFLPPDITKCSYVSVNIKPTQSFIDYLWNTGATTSSIYAKDEGIYWLRVKDEHSCIGIDSIVINYKPCKEYVWVPTAFTPNGDGKNDIFRPIFLTTPVTNIFFRVFDRWGNKIFESQKYTDGWNGIVNGEPQSTGTYVWQLSFDVDAGNSQKGTTEKIVKQGSVVLIR